MEKGIAFGQKFLSALHNNDLYKRRAYNRQFRDDMDAIQTMLFTMEIFKARADITNINTVYLNLLTQNKKVRKAAEEAFISICTRELEKTDEKKLIISLKKQIKKIEEIPGHTEDMFDIFNQVFKDIKIS